MNRSIAYLQLLHSGNKSPSIIGTKYNGLNKNESQSELKIQYEYLDYEYHNCST